MNILFYTPNFFPKTGGLENVAAYLSEGLANEGFNVKLITSTKLENNQNEIESNYEVIRSESKLALFQNYLWCDVFFHHNVSLKGIWPFLVFPFKKWVVLHHLTYFDHGKIKFTEQVKRQLSRFAINISCSNFVNNTLPKKGEVIYNAFDQDVFFNKNIERDAASFVFVGRLVSDKGCKLLIESFNTLINSYQKKDYKLTIIGDGPDKPMLLELVESYQLEKNIHFRGIIKGIALNDVLNENQIIIIPSIWDEPFGIVCLEGIAAGCVPIVSNKGGLVEAVGNIGIEFASGNEKSLTDTIIQVKENYANNYRESEQKRTAHLSNFKKEIILKKFKAKLAKLS